MNHSFTANTVLDSFCSLLHKILDFVGRALPHPLPLPPAPFVARQGVGVRTGWASPKPEAVTAREFSKGSKT